MPIENLRQLAIKLNANGIEKNEILTAFLEDVIDMIVGHYEGRNLNLK